MSSPSFEVPPFAQALAHEGDPLPDHLAAVAARTAAALRACPDDGIRRVAVAAALCHDAGKGTHYFQDYLLHAGPRTPCTQHAALGAWLSLWLSQSWPLHQRLALFVACLRHHGNLCRSWDDELSCFAQRTNDSEDPLRKQLAAMDLAGAEAFLRREGARHGLPLPSCQLSGESLRAALPSPLARRRAVGRGEGFGTLERAACFLVSWGAFLAEDKLHAAPTPQLARRNLPGDLVERFKARRLRAASALHERRERIAAEVRKRFLAAPRSGLFELTAPTGSGKTLAALGAVLEKRARERDAGRVIYCLPFLSLIEQTTGVLRDVLEAGGLEATSDLLLEHHHRADAVYRTAEGEYGPDGVGILLTETWQSEVVVTTYHQFLHAFFSGRNRHAKRCAALAGATVILDEPQTLPLRYWRPVGRFLEVLASRLGASFLLTTATQPGLAPREKICRLLPDSDEHFAALSRVRLECRHQQPEELEDFAERLGTELTRNPEATLVVLNRRAHARLLCERLRACLPGRPVLSLSTSLTPRDRRARIAEVQRLLAAGEAVVLVSTQVIEAGVDLSFPRVWRDLAPLDSVLQTAGRCNRHGELRRGRATLLHLKQEGVSSWRGIYDAPRIHATLDALGDADELDEPAFLDLVRRYFGLCEQRISEDRVDDLLAAGNFEELRKRFQLVEERPSQAWFVAADDDAEAEALWATFQAARDARDDEALQRARRRQERAFFARVVEAPGDAHSPLRRAPQAAYDPCLGLLWERLS
ncbi:MAG: CRISPR-associated endonuclease Cas3'' [Planctomycetota bacterium]|nr:MAG: CRISPR-associated endonuclease Cas3'' [Planctomycetota bacterium]